MAVTCHEHLDIGKTFFNIFVNTGQICTGLESDTKNKVTETCLSYETFGLRVLV